MEDGNGWLYVRVRRVRRATPRAVQVYLLGGQLLCWLPRACVLGGWELSGGDGPLWLGVRSDVLLGNLRAGGVEGEFLEELFREGA